MSIQEGLFIEELTPETIGNNKFSIPIYQRLYEWEKKEIYELLKDLLNAFSSNRDKPYYIGTIVTSYDPTNQVNDLIDGQQRITTLTLIGYVLLYHYGPWETFIKYEEKLRLSFQAREEDMEYLLSLLRNDSSKINLENVNNKIPAAIKYIQDFFYQNAGNFIHEFARYIFENSKMILMRLPEGTDLNKYFEIMNNRGEQLEKHEILKARLLKQISEDKRYSYSKLWDACSQMNGYLEDYFENCKKEVADFDGSDTKLTRLINKIEKGGDEGDEPHTLIGILKLNLTNYTAPPQKPGQKSENITSILSFPYLLLHAYATFTRNIPSSFSDKNLLEIIDFSKGKEKVDDFFKHLLKVRLIFDNYILKSVVRENEYKWEVRYFEETNTNECVEYNRRALPGNLSSIQAMLHASTDSENWLTPFLRFILDSVSRISPESEEAESKKLLDWLEMHDNELAYERYAGANKLRNIAQNAMHANAKAHLNKFSVVANRFSYGTAAYWFYKLDYCLLKSWLMNIPENLNSREIHTLIRKFQFRENRSVEHIYPQHPENTEVWEKESLDCYGNIALISASSNSKYNNNNFIYKKEQFNLHNKKYGLESLKLLDIYSYKTWDKDSVSSHQNRMITVMNEYNNNLINGN